jgi:hypothetical protein
MNSKCSGKCKHDKTDIGISTYLCPSGLNANVLIGPKCPLTPLISSCKI